MELTSFFLDHVGFDGLFSGTVQIQLMSFKVSILLPSLISEAGIANYEFKNKNVLDHF